MMNKIIGYAIIEKSNLPDLLDSVSFYLGEGWQPIGGITAVSSFLEGQRFIQAIVKYGGEG